LSARFAHHGCLGSAAGVHGPAQRAGGCVILFSSTVVCRVVTLVYSMRACLGWPGAGCVRRGARALFDLIELLAWCQRRCQSFGWRLCLGGMPQCSAMLAGDGVDGGVVGGSSEWWLWGVGVVGLAIC
jgi:hypothetical protein